VTRKELERLGALADLIYDRERARLQESAGRIAEIETATAEIHAARRGRAAALSEADGSDLAALTPADARWLDWGDARLRDLQLRRAALEAERAALFAATSRAFGRQRAIRAMSRDLAEAARMNASRRAEQA
jgi:hypothetical protein